MPDHAPPAPAKWRGPCADNPQAWDLDTGSLEQWMAAQRICNTCPLLAPCQRAREEFWPLSDPRRPAFNPKGVIWAGLAYSASGRVMGHESLRKHATLMQHRAVEMARVDERYRGGRTLAAS